MRREGREGRWSRVGALPGRSRAVRLGGQSLPTHVQRHPPPWSQSLSLELMLRAAPIISSRGATSGVPAALKRTPRLTLSLESRNPTPRTPLTRWLELWHAICTRDWELRNFAMKRMTPHFFASSMHNYEKMSVDHYTSLQVDYPCSKSEFRPPGVDAGLLGVGLCDFWNGDRGVINLYTDTCADVLTSKHMLSREAIGQSEMDAYIRGKVLHTSKGYKRRQKALQTMTPRVSNRRQQTYAMFTNASVMLHGVKSVFTTSVHDTEFPSNLDRLLPRFRCPLHRSHEPLISSERANRFSSARSRRTPASFLLALSQSTSTEPYSCFILGTRAPGTFPFCR
mmetsp:Transcript_15874/g.38652  ORF Transcript_15874/g.38652 Transcript_15874/m.38652 type:complete len:339 (-) Transcript_15874:223-1239(-)